MIKYFIRSSILVLSLTSAAFSEGEALGDVEKNFPIRKYGLKFGKNEVNDAWLQQHPNYKVKLFTKNAAALPKTVDLRKECPPVFDQGQLGSCTANALSGAVGFDLKKQGKYVGEMSRLFIYYNERKIEGTISQDAGASLSDGIKSLMINGVCLESVWPYSDNATTFKKQPSLAAYKQALQYRDMDNIKLASVTQDGPTIKNMLAKGKPIVFGISVYDSFESQTVATTGKVPMPNVRTENFLGGHALMLAGYDDTDGTFLVRNSWGTNWGLGGYCKMPQAYLLNSSLASDFWNISQVI